MAKQDKRRPLAMTRTVHIETTDEKIQQGEMPLLADECLIGREDRLETKKKAGDLVRILRNEPCNRFLWHLYDFLTLGFRRMFLGWMQDVEVELTAMAPATLSRMMNLVTWVLRCCREVLENLLQQSATWETTQETRDQFEQKISSIVVLVRGGLDERGVQLATRRLKDQMKLKAKERSHLLLRCSIRMVVEQQQWALVFVEKSKRGRIESVGKYIFQDYVNKGLPCMLVKLLRDYTSSRAERHFFLLVVTAMQQLLRASAKVPALSHMKQRRKIFHKRFGGIGTFFDAERDGDDTNAPPARMSDNAELSIFVCAVREPKILAKLLSMLAGSAALHPSIVDSVLGLLMCVAEHKWTSMVLGWNLAHVQLFHDILTTRLSILESFQSLIKHSVFSMAEIHKSNKFVAAELMFAATVLSAGSDDANLLGNYVMPERSTEAIFNATTTYSGSWTPREIIKLFNLYEKFKFEGSKRVLRYLRREMRSRSPDDIAMKLASLHILDPFSAGYDLGPNCHSVVIVEKLLKVVTEEEQLLDEFSAITDLSDIATLNQLQEAADSGMPLCGEKISILKLRLLNAEVLQKCLGIGIDFTENDNILVLTKEPPRSAVDDSVHQDFFSIIKSLKISELDGLKRERRLRRSWSSQFRRLPNEWDSLGNELLGVLMLELRGQDAPIDLLLFLKLVETEIRKRRESLLKCTTCINDENQNPNDNQQEKPNQPSASEESTPPEFDVKSFRQVLTPLQLRTCNQVFALFGFNVNDDFDLVINQEFPLVSLDNRLRRLRGYVRMNLDHMRAIVEREIEKRPTATSQEFVFREDSAFPRRKFKDILSAVISLKKTLSQVLCREHIELELDRHMALIELWSHCLIEWRAKGDQSQWGAIQDLILTAEIEEEIFGPEEESIPASNIELMKSDLKEDLTAENLMRGNLPFLTNLPTDRKRFLYPLGPLKDFIECQHLLAVLKGNPDRTIQPLEWRWKKVQINSLCLLKSAALIRISRALNLEKLIDLRHSLKKTENEIWIQLLEALKDEAPMSDSTIFDDNLFINEQSIEVEDEDLFGDAEQEREMERQQEQARRKRWEEVKNETKQRERKNQERASEREDSLTRAPSEPPLNLDVAQPSEDQVVEAKETATIEEDSERISAALEEDAIAATNALIWAEEEDSDDVRHEWQVKRDVSFRCSLGLSWVCDSRTGFVIQVLIILLVTCVFVLVVIFLMMGRKQTTR
eukprot:Gregarina_sp_Poly_1__116@NODE_1026_length_5316_cov_53_860735_g264_i1_p1_GENE_NODE_1026_length_5316_cov_53_860735_g264_i1NODE_1026_length_5316_cov_53_860735_g264_i1_p1_ORF_typecomplete_len1222_score217_66DUF4407/PF14362_6/0_052P5ATPase/PF12409_8/0_19Lin8/PF03353_15/1_5e02Lin8/PF03353_15/7_4DUF4139/PF13598_6/1_5e02DUF4139/PF13598_6/36_NODE_1026_length_5316_cov_53_860735_g264_i114695134